MMRETEMCSVEGPCETKEISLAVFSPVSPRGAETILLVDDIDMLRALTRIILEAQGYVVLEAANGEEALFIASTYEGPIDLVLTDLVMPVMNGSEVAGRILSDRCATRVLYMSGCREDAVLEQCGAAPGSGMLLKPFAPGVLLRKVRAALDASPDKQGRTVGRSLEPLHT